MMMPARTRISRVRMKNGGADVFVLHREPEGAIIGRARELIADALTYTTRPSSFVGVFFWQTDNEPWRPSFCVGWDTVDPNLPLPRLMRVAGAEMSEYAAVLKAEDKIMRRLGYERDDEPDPAA
jgi:hypothetical protein